MMRSHGTWSLLAVAVGLLAYILLFERPGTSGQNGASPAPLFPQMEPDRVTALTIVQTNGTVRVERVADQWQLAAPAYPARALAVENWLEAVAQSQRGAPPLDATDLLALPGGLAALGLEPPRADITIEQGTRRFQFRLGQRTPLGEKMYLQIVGADVVEITGTLPLERLPASALDWRDPTFVSLTGLRADRLHMRAPSREFEVQRDPTNRLWRLTRPRTARADQGRVEQLLQQLQTLKVAQFLSEFASADLDPLGLQTPAATLTIAEGTNTLLTLEFGLSPTNAPDLLYARRSNLPGIVVVPRVALDGVALSYGDLLDYRLVDVPIELVDRVEVGASGRFVLQRSAGRPWTFEEPAGLPADPALTAVFLDRLNGLRIAEVAKEAVIDPDLPTYGLVPPFRQYALRWPVASGGTATSAWLRVDFSTNRAERVYARRSDETPVYSLRLEDCVALPGAAFELRDRRIWEFTTNQVQSVTVTHQGVSRTLLRSPGGQWAFAPGSQGLVNTFALEETIVRFGLLRAHRWTALGDQRETLEHFGVPQVAHQLKIDLLVSGRPMTRTLDFGATSPSGGPYAVVTLESGPTVFEVPLETFHPYDEVVRSMALPKSGPP